ncbi:hypothetical protein [Alienimonas sp. DA493]|uniref:hypothetical protein n=1 Tax=Alienimonas sp. DA493 TaxID=3373605 RepID=UPI003754E397
MQSLTNQSAFAGTLSAGASATEVYLSPAAGSAGLTVEVEVELSSVTAATEISYVASVVSGGNDYPILPNGSGSITVSGTRASLAFGPRTLKTGQQLKITLDNPGASAITVVSSSRDLAAVNVASYANGEAPLKPAVAGRTLSVDASGRTDLGAVGGTAVSGPADLKATGFSTHNAADVVTTFRTALFGLATFEDRINTLPASGTVPTANALPPRFEQLLIEDGTGHVTAGNMRGTDGANTATPLDAAGVRAALGFAAADADAQLDAILAAAKSVLLVTEDGSGNSQIVCFAGPAVGQSAPLLDAADAAVTDPTLAVKVGTPA